MISEQLINIEVSRNLLGPWRHYSPCGTVHYSFTSSFKCTNGRTILPYKIGIAETGVFLIGSDETVRIVEITATSMIWEKGDTRFLLVR